MLGSVPVSDEFFKIRTYGGRIQVMAETDYRMLGGAHDAWRYRNVF